MSWREIHFDEILISEENDNPKPYMITEQEVENAYGEIKNVSKMQSYNQALFLRLLESKSKGRRTAFIEFNMKLAKKPDDWLISLEELFASRKVKSGVQQIFLDDVSEVLSLIDEIRSNSEKKNTNLETILQKESLTIEEAAIYLDLEVSYLYKLTQKKEIRFSKPGGKKIYFSKKDLEDWMQSNPIESKGDIDKEAANFLLRKKR